MMRYIDQQDEYSCGAIATFNLLKWTGKRLVRRKDFKRVCKGCKCTVMNGTNPFDIVTYLKKQLPRYKVWLRKHPKIKDLENHLKRGKAAVILLYAWREIWSGEGWGHYIVVTKQKGKHFVTINDSCGCPVGITSRSTIINHLRRRKLEDGPYPEIIYVLKK